MIHFSKRLPLKILGENLPSDPLFFPEKNAIASYSKLLDSQPVIIIIDKPKLASGSESHKLDDLVFIKIAMSDHLFKEVRQSNSSKIKVVGPEGPKMWKKPPIVVELKAERWRCTSKTKIDSLHQQVRKMFFSMTPAPKIAPRTNRVA